MSVRTLLALRKIAADIAARPAPTWAETKDNVNKIRQNVSDLQEPLNELGMHANNIGNNVRQTVDTFNRVGVGERLGKVFEDLGKIGDKITGNRNNTPAPVPPPAPIKPSVESTYIGNGEPRGGGSDDGVVRDMTVEHPGKFNPATKIPTLDEI